ncbi:hypothetical protein ACNQ2I_00160 [Mycoplasma sp. Z355B]|uniref:hypothetical protein n=1 Tax=unclassified Mycoplasma TaxID=2683645 RepID=UPI003A8A1E9D
MQQQIILNILNGTQVATSVLSNNVIQNEKSMINEKNISDLTEDEKIKILLLCDFLSKIDKRELNLTEKQFANLIKEIKNKVNYNLVKKSLHTRKYYYAGRALEKSDIQFLGQLLDMLNRYFFEVYGGNGLIQEDNSKNLFDSTVAFVLSFISTVGAIIGDIASLGTISIFTTLSIGSLILSTKDIIKQVELAQKSGQIIENTPAKKRIMSRIKTKGNELGTIYKKILNNDSKTVEQLKAQNEALEELYDFLRNTQEMLKFSNMSTKKIDGYFKFLETCIKNNTDYIGVLEGWKSPEELQDNNGSAWIYNPILGEMYDPY